MGGYHVESHADQSAVVGVGKDDEYDCSEYDDDDDDDHEWSVTLIA